MPLRVNAEEAVTFMGDGDVSVRQLGPPDYRALAERGFEDDDVFGQHGHRLHQDVPNDWAAQSVRNDIVFRFDDPSFGNFRAWAAHGATGYDRWLSRGMTSVEFVVGVRAPTRPEPLAFGVFDAGRPIWGLSWGGGLVLHRGAVFHGEGDFGMVADAHHAGGAAPTVVPGVLRGRAPLVPGTRWAVSSAGRGLEFLRKIPGREDPATRFAAEDGSPAYLARKVIDVKVARLDLPDRTRDGVVPAVGVIPAEGVRFYPDWNADVGQGLPRGHIGSPYYVSLSLRIGALVLQPGGGIVLHDRDGRAGRLTLQPDGSSALPIAPGPAPAPA